MDCPGDWLKRPGKLLLSPANSSSRCTLAVFARSWRCAGAIGRCDARRCLKTHLLNRACSAAFHRIGRCWRNTLPPPCLLGQGQLLDGRFGTVRYSRRAHYYALILLRFARRHLYQPAFVGGRRALGIICSARAWHWGYLFFRLFRSAAIVYWMMMGFGGVDWQRELANDCALIRY